MTAKPDYPHTRVGDIAEDHFGARVADPYRWLENDVRNDGDVSDWVTAQNKVTDAYLETLPGREIFADRLKSLFDYERFGIPVKAGGRYFYQHNSGLQNQPVLWMREALNGEGRVLIDPNGWSDDGATALGEWLPSDDGRWMLYSVQDGGSDWRTARLLNIETGEQADDQLEWLKFTLGASWSKDGAGFYYARYPEPPAEAEKFQAINRDHSVWYHRLGTAQTQDRLVYATPDRPTLSHYPHVTDDGRWLVITSTEGTDARYEITLIDLTDAAARPRTLIAGLDHEWSFAGNIGSVFYWATNKDAPRMRIVAMDVSESTPEVRELVAEDSATLEGARVVMNMLLASYLNDVKTEVRRFDLNGKPLGAVDLPGIGTASGFGGDQDDPETFFAFTSFATPTTIYHYNVVSGEMHPWAQPDIAFDPDAYVVDQQFFTSKDGTQVPMFIVHKKGIAQPAPTLLYAYGGFNISLPPSFSSARVAWMEQGGVYALANIRGGGEYGKAWHDAGRLHNKQNSFDDFIAASEFLIAKGITRADQLAIQGGSNGGLLMGAVTNQRPELFSAVIAQVGVMDMLRFDQFTAGRYWVDDYGSPAKQEDFEVLLKYSPYHNVRNGAAYPAILVATADTDDRVVPGHSFKYAAMLQASDIGDKPHLIRIETRAGHGSGMPTDKLIAEYADFWAFAARWTGLNVTAVPSS